MSTWLKAKRLFGKLTPGDSFFTHGYGPVMPGGLPREWFVSENADKSSVVLVCKTYVLEETEIDCRYAVDERWVFRSFTEWEFIYAHAVATRE